MKRPLYNKIWDEFNAYKQMTFISGPRQSGKTTLAKIIAGKYSNSLYFNWDIIDHKKKIIENPLFYEEVERNDSSKPLIIFDEIHKYSNWKNYLKSVYDRDAGLYKFLISGSGRLDIYQKGGDSLAGRYFIFYLWPFTLAELAKKNLSHKEFFKNPVEINNPKKETWGIWNDLSNYSGFPDPYLTGKDKFYKTWSNTYKKQLLREDIRDLTSLRNFNNVEILFSLIPSKIGSPLSMSNLARDIKVSFDTIKKWLDIFEQFFLAFRISPWSGKIARAISKEKKIYLYDYAGIESHASRFENMVALELWRAIYNWNDTGLGDFSLHYVRNRDKEEVDFLIANKNEPFLLIETKSGDTAPAKALKKFQSMLNIPGVQLVNKPGVCRLVSNNNQKILVASAPRWLSGLP